MGVGYPMKTKKLLDRNNLSHKIVNQYAPVRRSRQYIFSVCHFFFMRQLFLINTRVVKKF